MGKHGVIGVDWRYLKRDDDKPVLILEQIEVEIMKHDIPVASFFAGLWDWGCNDYAEDHVYWYGEGKTGAGKKYMIGITFWIYKFHGFKLGVAHRVRQWGKGVRGDDPVNRGLLFMTIPIVELVPRSPKTPALKPSEDPLSELEKMD